MSNWLPISLLVFAFAAADLPKLPLLPASERNFAGNSLSGENISFLPLILAEGVAQSGTPQKSPAPKSASLTEPSKLALIRYVSGEFAKVRKPIPGGKEGFVLYTDKPLNQEYRDRVVSTHRAAINTGSNAQLPQLEFREHTIIVDINGGRRAKPNCRRHIHRGLGRT